MYVTEQGILDERYDLAVERIRQITELLQNKPAEALQEAADPFSDYFAKVGSFILLMDRIRTMLADEDSGAAKTRDWQAVNNAMYEDILPEHYPDSYANPDTAVRLLGEEHGQALCFLYAQIRGLTGWVFEGFTEAVVIHLELFLEIYGCFSGKEIPSRKTVRQILYWFVSDYCDVLVAERIRRSVDPARDFAVKIVRESDLDDPSYLYRYGEYVTENEIRLAEYMASLPEEKIELMAGIFTEGYREGFVIAGKDLSKKLTVNIHYHLGFERVVRRAIEKFAGMGLRPVIYRYALSSVNKRGVIRSGFTGAAANQQYEFDHKEDAALYLDRRFMQRRLSVIKNTYETFLTLANGYAGPALIEVFGEKPFEPVKCSHALKLSQAQQKIQVEMNNEVSQLTNRYIIGEERSFTVIAFPVPDIGPAFEEIFDETIRVNTLDTSLYRKIQQAMADTLDRGKYVHILGQNGNRTDLTVAIQSPGDPEKETAFENCLADVNIPLGEVFTTPKLEGTNGILHVTGVYLEGLYYEDLSMTFRDGMITGYSCTNYEDPEEGAAFIRATVLHHHPTLPMGEFAIGTNTAAYRMGRKYRIQALLPILIAEKTGPHFAVGDTCYSWSEDIPIFNPDGKECIARENSISALRKTDPGKAYFGCHTDITIPYEELGLIEAVMPDGSRVPIIRDGKFVLEGTQELNRELERED